MPATRSRTENWRQSLREIHERHGSLEITLPHVIEKDGGAAVATDQGAGKHLIWRVRIVGLNDEEIFVEEPSAMGQTIPIAPGVRLVAIIAIGQNRWMFETENLGAARVALNDSRATRALRLRMPGHVERCQRRNFYRISTVGLDLPRVECRTLLDLPSAAVAEAANRIRIHELQDADITGLPTAPAQGPGETMLPEAGPAIPALLINIGGGGAGLLFEPTERGSVEGEKPLFLRINLQPHIPEPIAVTGRIRHTHIDSAQRLYAGVAFEFGHDPSHQKFIVDQLCRYVEMVQREQLRRLDR